MKRIGGAVALLLLAGAARAQTMLDQEQRLIEIHSLLIALPPGTAPGAYRPWDVSLGIELVTIPAIDGTTGIKRQITASDRTPIFPRPRFALGLPAPADFRAYVGLAYIPPIPINDVSSHLLGLEGSFSWDRGGPFSVGLRGYGVVAQSKSPVTDPNTRDTLDTFDVGADLSAAYRFDFTPGSVTPFAGAGVSYVAGNFRVTSDNQLLTSRTVNPGLNAGVRFFSRLGIEGMVEWVVYPGRLVHPIFTIAWMPTWFTQR
jgi:hypothetical protein